jgi:hypothetical protein
VSTTRSRQQQGCLTLAEECRLLALEATMAAACPCGGPAGHLQAPRADPNQPAAAVTQPAGDDKAAADGADVLDDPGEGELGLEGLAGSASRVASAAATQQQQPRLSDGVARQQRARGTSSSDAAVAASAWASSSAAVQTGAEADRALSLSVEDGARILGYEQHLYSHVERLLDGASAATLFR